MVKLTRIYTRGGDKGKTSLGNGTRVSKADARVEAYGAVDEANALIGLARLHAVGQGEAWLATIQNNLFDLGADLCQPIDENRPALRVTQAQIDLMESVIDIVNGKLAPLNSFILPAGSVLACQLHHARTVVRRAERLMVRLSETSDINPLAIAYVNRLSDLLFVLARHANMDGRADVLWVPGGNPIAEK